MLEASWLDILHKPTHKQMSEECGIKKQNEIAGELHKFRSKLSVLNLDKIRQIEQMTKKNDSRLGFLR